MPYVHLMLTRLSLHGPTTSRPTTVVDQTTILWPSVPWVGETYWSFRGTYCLHLHGDWVGLSGCWSYTENKFCWLSRMIWGCLAGHSYGGWEEGYECFEFRAMLFKISSTEKNRSWKPNYYKLETIPSPLTALHICYRPNYVKSSSTVRGWEKLFLLITIASVPNNLLPWRGGSMFLRNVATFNRYVMLKPKRFSSQKMKDIEI
jgi:hypothetical protein